MEKTHSDDVTVSFSDYMWNKLMNNPTTTVRIDRATRTGSAYSLSRQMNIDLTPFAPSFIRSLVSLPDTFSYVDKVEFDMVKQTCTSFTSMKDFCGFSAEETVTCKDGKVFATILLSSKWSHYINQIAFGTFLRTRYPLITSDCVTVSNKTVHDLERGLGINVSIPAIKSIK